MAEDLVEVAFVADEVEAAMIQALLEEHRVPSLVQQIGPSGPQLGYGLMNPGGGARRVMVHAQNADRARSLIEATRVVGDEFPEPVNAEYLDEGAGGRKPRNYNVIGAYARAYLAAFVAFALFFAVWLLSRAL